MARNKIRVDGKKIATLRGSHGWTQKELAGKTDLSIRKIQELEEGGWQSQSTVARLAKTFGIEVETLREAEPSIAVLPFSNLNPSDNNEYIREGLAAEVSNALTRLGMKVIPPRSLLALAATQQGIHEIRRVAGVSALLEGGIECSDRRVRVIVNLTSAADGRHLWSERYECELADVFGVRDSIAEAVAKSLHLHRLLSSVPERRPKNIEAWNAHRKGVHYFERLGPPDLERAETYFREAISLDPDYTPSYVQLASCYHTNALFYLKPAHDVMPEAKAAALSAVKLNERESEAHAALAAIVGPFDYDWKEALRRCRLALSGDLVSTWTRFACAYLVLIPLLRFDEAIEVLTPALEVDPLSLLARLALASAYSARGSHDLAMAELRKLLEFQGDYWPAHWNLGLIFWGKGMEAEAIAAWNQCFVLAPWYPPLLGCIAATMARAGKRGDAEALLGRLAAWGMAHVSSVGYGWFHVLCMEYEAAAEHFEKVIEARDPNVVWMSSEGVFEGFRGSERGRELVRRMGLPVGGRVGKGVEG